ncbi:hypothetical protein T02_5441 [Trichinella nativa]|uniref:Uncharacterized protein n=1 Tax=Trichinella nativa TaxID=6335 RepID=A0A0V1KVI9_9BILA|nr:hypothetical protein T02_5441 [Trichinella nativa]
MHYMNLARVSSCHPNCAILVSVISDSDSRRIFWYLLTLLSVVESSINNNLLTVSTDGDPAMVGCHRKFIAQLKNSATDVLAVHCAIRR